MLLIPLPLFPPLVMVKGYPVPRRDIIDVPANIGALLIAQGIATPMGGASETPLIEDESGLEEPGPSETPLVEEEPPTQNRRTRKPRIGATDANP